MCEQTDIQTLARGQDGRPVVISFESAKALREQGRAFVHKPESLKFIQRNDQDNGPEAA